MEGGREGEEPSRRAPPGAANTKRAGFGGEVDAAEIEGGRIVESGNVGGCWDDAEGRINRCVDSTGGGESHVVKGSQARGCELRRRQVTGNRQWILDGMVPREGKKGRKP